MAYVILAAVLALMAWAIMGQLPLQTILGWTGSNTTPTANFDLSAFTPESDFTRYNSHYFLTEPYWLQYVVAQSSTMTDARLTSPTFLQLNADGFRVTGFQRAAGVSGAPTLTDRFEPGRVILPMYEEIQAQASCTGAAEQQYVLMSIVSMQGAGTNNGLIPLPDGQEQAIEGKTGSFTPSANVWSGPQSITWNASLKGGVYAVVRAQCQQTSDCLAFRLNFNRHPTFKGRKPRPGWFVQNTIGAFEDVITQINPYHLGTLGFFATTEYPQLEVLATTSAAMTPILRLWVRYLGGNLSNLDQWINKYTVS